MAAIDVVKASIPTSVLVGLTNDRGVADLNDATLIDDTYLAAQISIAEGWFTSLTGLAMDSTDAQHKGPLALGTRAALLLAKGQTDNFDRWYKLFAESCAALISRVAIALQTSSTLDPTAEQVGARPDFDRGGFVRGLTTENPNRRNQPTKISPEDS